MLDDISVRYAHLTFGPSARYTSGSHSLQQLTLVIDVGPLGLPSDAPVVALDDFTLEIMYSFPESTSEGAMGSVEVSGQAVVELGGCDANCSFYFSRDADVIEDELDEGVTAFNPTAEADVEETGADASTAFSGYLDVSFAFQSQVPTIGEIVSAILKEPLDKSGLNSLTSMIPSELTDILGGVEFQAVDMRILKDASTNEKWQVVFFHVSVSLRGFEPLLGLLEPYVTFDMPSLDVVIHYPADSAKRAYDVAVGSKFAFGNGSCLVKAIWHSAPPGFANNPATITLSLVAEPGHPGLPISEIVDKFIELSLSALNIDSRMPDAVKDVLKPQPPITIDEAMITFIKLNNKWQRKWIEVLVTSQAVLQPFESFQFSQIQLHLAHDTGVDTGRPADTIVQFNANLLVGTDTNISAGFTYDTAAGWTVTFTASQSIDLVDLIGKGIQGIGLAIPPDIRQEINGILKIDIKSFYIAYSTSQDGSKTIVFSNDSGSDPGDAVSLFGIGVTNIAVTCTEDASKTWSYTIALSFPTPFAPLATFCNIPLLSDIQVSNGKFAFIKGTPAKSAIGNAQVPSGLASTQVVLCGTIAFTGSDFMNLLHVILQIDSVDMVVSDRHSFQIVIPSAGGKSLLGVFQVTSFFLNFQETGFALGSTLSITASWLADNPITPTFNLIVLDDGGFGGSISIPTIDKPFGLSGLVLTNLNFSLVWLAEAEEPQSIRASAAVGLASPDGDDISAR